MIIGTPYFLSIGHAAKYYRDSDGGWGYETAQRKRKAGEIFIGKPPLKPGQRLQIIDGGTRYAIVEEEKV